MTTNDLPAFLDSFRSLARVFPIRASDDELRQLESSYFKALRGYAIGDVQQGADAWIANNTKFPRPAEWKTTIPARTLAGNYRQMGDSEARDYRRAELLGCEDQPCLCHECVRAGIDEKPLRFVPEFDDLDLEIRVYDPIGKRVVTQGHWAHGDELARWYEARANFYNRWFELFGATTPREKQRVKVSLEQRLREIYTERTRTPRVSLE